MRLHEILNEEAAMGAVDAGSIAGARGSLFGGGVVPTNTIRRNVGSKPNVLKPRKKKRPKTVAGVPVINFNNEA